MGPLTGTLKIRTNFFDLTEPQCTTILLSAPENRGLIMNKVNHKVVKPYRLKEHSVNVRAVRTESSSFYSERCSPAAAAAAVIRQRAAVGAVTHLCQLSCRPRPQTVTFFL